MQNLYSPMESGTSLLFLSLIIWPMNFVTDLEGVLNIDFICIAQPSHLLSQNSQNFSRFDPKLDHNLLKEELG